VTDFHEKARWWSYRRQRLGRRASDAGEALRGVVAVYSSHPTAPLSLHARAGGFDAAGFRWLEEDRAALRLPAMRGSIHVLPRESAHLAFRATSPTTAAQRWRLRYAGVSEERYDELKTEILEAAREPRTSRQIGAEIDESGESLRAVIQTMTFEGVLLRVGAEGLRSNALRYVAADAWLVDGLPDAHPDEALSWLAGEYLRAFGPAHPEDFRWWTGVSKERATTALSSVETVEVGEGYLLPAADGDGFEAIEAPGPGSVDLLPKWDCYTMGYAPDGRRRLVRPDLQGRAYSEVGDGLGVVLVDGEAAGAWEARFPGGDKKMQVDLDLFKTPGATLKQVIEDRFEEVAALLGARSLSLG
jgi:Winged helix DNA-binding domain